MVGEGTYAHTDTLVMNLDLLSILFPRTLRQSRAQPIEKGNKQKSSNQYKTLQHKYGPVDSEENDVAYSDASLIISIERLDINKRHGGDWTGSK